MWNGAVGSSWNADRKTVKEKPHITKKRGVKRRSGGNHSDFSAMTGSTRDARHAGTALASAATAVSADGDRRRTSRDPPAVTPCSSPRSSRVDAERQHQPGRDADRARATRRCRAPSAAPARGPRRSPRESRSRASAGSPRTTARRRCRPPTASARAPRRCDSSTLGEPRRRHRAAHDVLHRPHVGDRQIRIELANRVLRTWDVSADGVARRPHHERHAANQIGVAERACATGCAARRTSP